MFSPQEVAEQKFEKAVFGGYEMTAVDDFLEKLTRDYEQLFRENSVLKEKMKTLLNTLEEYRSVDEAMRRVLLSAQRMAEDIVQKAKVQANAIVSEARGIPQETGAAVHPGGIPASKRVPPLSRDTTPLPDVAPKGVTPSKAVLGAVRPSVGAEGATVEFAAPPKPAFAPRAMAVAPEPRPGAVSPGSEPGLPPVRRFTATESVGQASVPVPRRPAPPEAVKSVPQPRPVVSAPVKSPVSEAENVELKRIQTKFPYITDPNLLSLLAQTAAATPEVPPQGAPRPSADSPRPVSVPSQHPANAPRTPPFPTDWSTL